MLHKKIEESFGDNRNFIISLVASSILMSLLLMLPILKNVLIYSPSIKDFSEHVMSSATSFNLDIGNRIKSYYLVFFGIVFIFFGFFISFYKLFYKISNNNDEFFIYIKNLSFIGIAGIISSFLSSFDLAIYFVGGAVFLSLVFFKTSKSKNLNNSDIALMIWNILIAIPLTLFIWVILRKYNTIEIISKKPLLKIGLSESIFFILIWFIVTLCIYFFIRVIIQIITKKFNISIDNFKSLVVISSIPVMFTGIIQSICLEIGNILNKRFEIILNKPYLLYLIILMISIIAMLLIFIKLAKKERNFNLNIVINKIYIPGILITFCLIIAQPAKMASVGNEFFEMANHGLSVDHFFRYGSLPIVETFDAHLLSNQVFAYIYSIFNGYEPWAAFLYDQYIQVIYIFILYIIIKSLIGEMNSFFFMISFSLLDQLFNMYFLLSAILAFCLYNYFKNKQTFQNSILFWLTATVLCIYRLDLGVAALFAAFLTYLVTALLYNRRTDIIKFFTMGFVTGCSALFIFVILCLFKKIDPLTRLVELIKICLSNQNWAYSTVGDNRLFVYYLVYFVFPLIVIFILGFTITKFFLFKKKILQVNQNHFIMLLFFSVFYLFNLSRGIVRHSLAEGTVTFILGTFSLSILVFVVSISGEKRKVVNFLVASLIVVILTNNTMTFNGSSSVAAKAISSVNYQDQYVNTQSFNRSRVSGEEPDDVKQLKKILDSTLAEEETYFDFSSSNYYYALVNRRNPIYANQSPLMLSGDKTQELALNEIKSQKPAFVLMPIFGNKWSDIDGIAVDFKYYLISEYIYENYTPLARLSNFDLYCLKGKEEIYQEKLKEQGILQNTLYSGDFSYISPTDLFKHNSDVNLDKGNMIIETKGEDPYFIGLWSQLMKSKPDIKENYDHNKPIKIFINLESYNSGNIQLFYTLNENEDFSEIQSQVFEVGQGTKRIEIELPTVPNEIRIDANSSKVTLTSIDISQGLTIINDQPEVWVRELGSIPKLWAEEDAHFRKAPNLIKPIVSISNFKVNASTIKHDQPMYLFLQIESATDQKSSIELVSKSKILGVFNFNLFKGTHEYAIRLSSDYKWWNGEVENVVFNTQENVTFNKISFYLEYEGEYKELNFE
ncbi:hypothetical protein EHV15_04000 [Paenibacillus oralis]|uniref:Uncharacterized protein n=1 Tax=Paenibacillus oralis TaxID=2490856 RepID=A0A3P3U103_9BACL|nr:hypothetical protein [Paenibacillus oralis]RRJ62203.1 hypothetical protein EHV15_04000 [Paenibacillus oralis]